MRVLKVMVTFMSISIILFSFSWFYLANIQVSVCKTIGPLFFVVVFIFAYAKFMFGHDTGHKIML